MDILLPQLGLFFWSTIIFLALFFLLRKFAWKPIMKGINDREDSIQNALDEARKAREEMKNLNAENEKLLAEARSERDAMLKEAREMKDRMISEAKTESDKEAKRIIQNAREQIESEKLAALTDIKNQVGTLSLEIAEKVLRHELSNPAAHKQVVDKLVDELHLN